MRAEVSMPNQDERPWYERVKYERLCCGWSQSEAAEKLGVDVHTLRRWEAGYNFPNYEGRRALRGCYGKTLEELGLLPSR
jgi:transcriptional regulator with XRE-family HTH domain